MLGAYCTYYVAVVLAAECLCRFRGLRAGIGSPGCNSGAGSFSPFPEGNVETGMIVGLLALIILFQTLATVSFGTESKWIPSAISGVLSFGSIQLPWDRAISVVIGHPFGFGLFICLFE